MAHLSPARSAALDALSTIRRARSNPRDFLQTSKKFAHLCDRDKTLAYRLVMGAIAAEGLLDVIIDSHSKHSRKPEPRLKDALKISVFELLYLRTPPDTAISQGTELARSVASYAAGFAHAVLMRTKEENMPALKDAKNRLLNNVVNIDDLCLAGALPRWIGRELLAALGPRRAAEFVLNIHEPVVSTEICLQDAVVKCDAASLEVVSFAEPQSSDEVLEIGQGTATKTLLLLNASKSSSDPKDTSYCHITAVEKNVQKTEIARQRVNRGGLGDYVECISGDGRMLERVLSPDKTYDLVFVDAPCSGTGTLRRHPDITWNIKEQDIPSLSELQFELLSAAAARVKDTGRLIYATCSVLSAENDIVVDRFLQSSSEHEFICTKRGPTTSKNADVHYSACLKRYT